MATMPVSHFTWQVLRALKRSKKPPTGRELRIYPSRSTKDGKFLDVLVGEGLIEIVSVDTLPTNTTEKQKRKPAQFRTRYKLTAKGQHAAEYGEYEREMKKAGK